MMAPSYRPVAAPLHAVVVTAAVVGALYLGRDVFIPVALAILLSFMLAPVVIGLQKRGIPKIVAVAVSVTIAFLLIAGFAYLIATQLTELATSLPIYQFNIRAKIDAVRTAALTEGIFGRIGRFLESIGRELSAAAPQEAPGRPAAGEKPMLVEVLQPATTPLQIIRSVVGPVLSPLATAGIVIVLVIFILLQRQDLRDRFIRLAGAGDLSRTTEALEEAGSRVARYLLMQLIVNLTYGIPIAIGLWWIGLPNALLWGLLATVFRFIPYVGPVIAAILPIALAVAVDPGWSMVLWTIGIFMALELVSNNLVEPWLYGSGTGLSAFAIIVAAIFWTWLWGPVGLLLSTPITVCLVVIGRHVPAFAFLDVLFGSEPVLTPPERFAQRLLAGDADEATEIAEKLIAESSLAAFHETVGLVALTSIERERERGSIDADRRRTAAAAMIQVVENLADEHEKPPGEHALGKSIVCIGGRGSLDDAASAIVASLLNLSGLTAEAMPLTRIGEAAPKSLAESIVLISYLADSSEIRARYLVKRLRRREPSLEIVLAFWAGGHQSEEIASSIRVIVLDASLKKAIEMLHQRSEGAPLVTELTPGR